MALIAGRGCCINFKHMQNPSSAAATSELEETVTPSTSVSVSDDGVLNNHLQAPAAKCCYS